MTPGPLRCLGLRHVLRPFYRSLLAVALLSLVINVLMLVPVVYMLQLYDRVLIGLSELTLLAVSVIALGLLAVMAGAEWLRSRLLVRAGERLDVGLGPRVYDANFEAHRSGSPLASTRAHSDFLQVRQFLTGTGIFALLDAPWAPIYIAVAYALHPTLGLVALVFVVLQVLLAWLTRRASAPAAEAATQAGTDVAKYLHSKLRNAEVVAALGMGEHLRRRWHERHIRSVLAASRAQAITERYVAWGKFLRYTQQSLGLAAGALLVIRGELSPGAMIAANLLIARALAPIEQLAAVWRGFSSTHAAFRRLSALLEAFPSRSPSVQSAPSEATEVTLRRVTAYARGRKQPILTDVSLVVRPGKLTVVLGHSGAGKSTLARVLLGTWPDCTGDILFGGVALTATDRVALGAQLGYLPQEVQLLEGTLAENIARFGAVDSDRILQAAQAAGLHELILRLPMGYDTAVGEGAQPLSAGQRQRIALARALYGDPAFVVLDEPNAHLDDAGEQALDRALTALQSAGRTAVVVTHRPAVLALADDVIVLHEGRVQAHGPRAEVLAALPALAASRLRDSRAAAGRPQPA